MQIAYRRAAVAYALYGALYLGGAVAALDEDRKGVFFGFVPWWSFYAVGGLILAIFPVLLWKEYKWVARILCLGPAAKALVLFWRIGLGVQGGEGIDPFQALFALTAVAAASLMAWAGWNDQR